MCTAYSVRRRVNPGCSVSVSIDSEAWQARAGRAQREGTKFPLLCAWPTACAGYILSSWQTSTVVCVLALLRPTCGCTRNWSCFLCAVRLTSQVCVYACTYSVTGGIDTSAHAVGHAQKRGNFVPSLCARPARACRASLSADTEAEHTNLPFYII